MATEQPSSTSNSTIKYAVVAIALFCLLILLVYGMYLHLRAPMGGDNIGIAWYAQYGDAFGVITSFFTAAGTIGLVATIVLQYQTLKAQQLELVETRKELSAQKDELAGQHRMMQLQTEILKGQSESSSYDIFIREYNDLYNGISLEDRREFFSKYENLEFEECLDLAHLGQIYSTLNYVEISLDLIGSKDKLFYVSRTDDEKRFMLLASILGGKFFPNISSLIRENIKREEALRLSSTSLWITRNDLVLDGLSTLARSQKSIDGQRLMEPSNLKDTLILHRRFRFSKALVTHMNWRCSPELCVYIDTVLIEIEKEYRDRLENLLSVLSEKNGLDSYGLSISDISGYLHSDQDAIDKKVEGIKEYKTKLDRFHDQVMRYT